MCEESFKYLEEMELHLEGYHSECSFSSKWFKTKDEMKEHLINCFACGNCKQTFKSNESLGKHVYEHETLNDTNVECNHCGELFKSEHRMYKHFDNIHEDEFEDW